MIGGLLIASAIYLHATNWERVREIDLFALVLIVQSLPFLAAIAIAALEGSRANDFALWQRLETKLAGVLHGRTAIAKAPAPVADNRVEPVQ